MIERDRARSVAGNHCEARVEALDEASEQRRDAASDFRLAARSIGKPGAIGGIDDQRIGQQLQRRPEHRKAADTGIEEQDGCVRVHGCSVARPRNGCKLRSKGFELEATGEVLPGWQIAAGYTHVSSSDDEGKTISAETPRHLLRASTNYRLPGELNAWTVGGGVSAQSSYSYFADDDPSVLMGAPGRAVWDARASYRINRTWTASLNVANLFDKTYYSMLGQLRRGNYYGDPRNVTLTLRGTF